MRFSKANLLLVLDRWADRLEKSRGFDPDNGTAQLSGRHTVEAVDYGYWQALRDIADGIESGTLLVGE